MVGPCSRGFTTTGSAWRSGAPGGVDGDGCWALVDRGTVDRRRRLAADLTPPGAYDVDVFIPAAFADATVTYVVVDATAGTR